MQEVSNYTQQLTNRISPIVEHLFKGNSFYMVRLKKQERIEHLVNLFVQREQGTGNGEQCIPRRASVGLNLSLF